jgi:hypothetical protein
MRSREVNMEKEGVSKTRDKTKLNKELLSKMMPQIQWRWPPLGKFHNYNQN